MTEREHSLAASMGDNEFVIMLIIHDCLRILKVLSRSSPLEPVYLGMDNLYIMNGRVRLCDPFLNRTRLWQENQLRQKQNEVRVRDSSDAADDLGRRMPPERQKLWQVQNLYFIGLLAARLLTKRMETDPIKIILDRKVGQS